MKATTKKTTVSTELIELQNEKKELAKLTKIIEKAPTKKEINNQIKIETLEEIKTINLLSENINYNFEKYINNKNLIKELQSKNNIIISNIFKEVSLLMTNFKKELESNTTNFKHIEFNRKSLIIILRNKLENKLSKELFNIYSTVLDYMNFNLTIQLDLISYSQLKTIVGAYSNQVKQDKYYTNITKNRIAKLKSKEDYSNFLKEISSIKSLIKKDKLIAEYLETSNKKESKLTLKKVS